MTSRLIAPLALVGAMLLLPQSAKAENFSLHLDTGAAVPVFNAQENTFKVGLSGNAEGQFLIGRNLAIGPMVNALTLDPREGQNYRHSPGNLWQFGGAVRIQGDHASDAWLSPYIDLSGGLGYVGRMAVPAANIALGADVALDASHGTWLGVFVRGTHAWRLDTPTADNLFTHNYDINVLSIGAAVTFDFPGKPREVIKTVTVTKPELIVERVPVFINEGARTNPPTAIAAGAPCPTATEAPLSLTEKVYFNVDQSSLDWMDRDALDVLIANLKAHPEVSVSVVGNASQDHKSLTPAQAKHDADLAQKRGQAVVSYLTSNGINASRILVSASANGSGGNETTEARERNRNATLKVEVLTK